MNYVCNICKYSLATLQQYNDHQYFHRDTLNSRYYCKHLNCESEFSKYRNFKMHLYRCHKARIRSKPLETFKCSKSNCLFKSGLQKEMSCHMYKHISNKEIVKCPYAKCSGSNHYYKTVSGLKSHIYRHHYIKEKLALPINRLEMNPEEYDCAVDDTNEENVIKNPEIRTNLADSFLKSLSETYLTLRAKFFLTDTALQRLIEGLTDLNNIALENVRVILQQAQQQHLLEAIEEGNMFNIAHNSTDGALRSAYTRKIFYKEKFHYVSPTNVFLGENLNKNLCFVYVPILETIKALMSNEGVYKQWSNQRQSRSGIFRDFIDGECYKKNPFFQNNVNALQILLYQDSFEVCNPLGSSKKIHKILGIYMVLGNIAGFCRSKVDQIQLVALVLEKHVKQFGFHKILEPIVKDLHHLEDDGVEIQTGEVVKGTIFAVIGDNLGSHQIGGFTESFNCKNSYFCRYCYITKFGCDSFMATSPLRTVSTYTGDADLAMLCSEMQRGVKCNSFLNELKYFHVCNPGLPPCLAHDIFEGVLAYDVMLCLQELCKTKICTYDWLNLSIQQVRFLHETKYEKVPIIKNAEKLQGNASENLRLILILPFACINVRNENKCWKLLDILRNICIVVMSVKLSTNQLAYLKFLIIEYLHLRSSLFKDINLRPKHHYLTHYPYLIKKFGPLRHVWTLRYESKHFYFKSLLKHSPNFKNVLHTLSERHQLLQALYTTQGTLFLDKVIADEAILYAASDYDDGISSVIQEMCFFKDKMYITTKATFRSIIYTTGMSVCCRKADDLYVLCCIKYIIVSVEYDNLFFVGDEALIMLDESLGLYINVPSIGKKQKLIGIHLDDLLSHDPLMCHITSVQTQLYHFKSAPYDEM